MGVDGEILDHEDIGDGVPTHDWPELPPYGMASVPLPGFLLRPARRDAFGLAYASKIARHPLERGRLSCMHDHLSRDVACWMHLHGKLLPPSITFSYRIAPRLTPWPRPAIAAHGRRCKDDLRNRHPSSKSWRLHELLRAQMRRIPTPPESDHGRVCEPEEDGQQREDDSAD